jgi:putative hydrolase of the HAD superfamily
MTSAKKKAVLFDVGGTLIDPRPPVGEVYAKVGRAYGLAVGAEQMQRVFGKKFSQRERQAALVAPDTERRWWSELVASVVEEFGGVRDFDGYFDELYSYFAKPGAWHVYPDVFPALGRLRDHGCALGIVSNWDSRALALCDSLGLRPYMDTIAVSALVGCAKPDATIFHRALRELDVRREEAIHVGDSIEMDWQGARNAGIDAVIVDRSGTPARPEITTIRSLDMLLNFI